MLALTLSIAIDSNDDVHISYYDTTNKDLKYATDKSGSWVTTSIDTSGIVGHYTSIAIDSNDDVHISYLDTSNTDLKYATDKSGSWVTTSIDTSGQVGYYTSIAIDSNDDVHISYYDTPMATSSMQPIRAVLGSPLRSIPLEMLALTPPSASIPMMMCTFPIVTPPMPNSSISVLILLRMCLAIRSVQPCLQD